MQRYAALEREHGKVPTVCDSSPKLQYPLSRVKRLIVISLTLERPSFHGGCK